MENNYNESRLDHNLNFKTNVISNENMAIRCFICIWFFPKLKMNAFSLGIDAQTIKI